MTPISRLEPPEMLAMRLLALMSMVALAEYRAAFRGRPFAAINQASKVAVTRVPDGKVFRGIAKARDVRAGMFGIGTPVSDLVTLHNHPI